MVKNMSELQKRLRENSRDYKKRENKLKAVDGRISKLQAKIKELEKQKVRIGPGLDESNEQIIREEFEKMHSDLLTRDNAYQGYLKAMQENRELFALRQEDEQIIADYNSLHETTKRHLQKPYEAAMARKETRQKLRAPLEERVEVGLVVGGEGKTDKDLCVAYLPMTKEDQNKKLFANLLMYAANKTLYFFGPQNGEGIFEISEESGLMKIQVMADQKQLESYVRALRSQKPEGFDEANVDFFVYDSRLQAKNEGRPHYARFKVTPVGGKHRFLALQRGENSKYLPSIGSVITLHYRDQILTPKIQKSGSVYVPARFLDLRALKPQTVTAEVLGHGEFKLDGSGLKLK